MLKRIVQGSLGAFGLQLRRSKDLVDPTNSWPQRMDGEGRGSVASVPNVLERFFDAHVTGPGIWKWRHYFEIYDRHFSKFVGCEANVLEIGIYSGGSLAMWRRYFGPKATIYGVDIEPACQVYEDDHTKILVGDQADPAFWAKVKQDLPPLDIVIDDGGHQAHQQIATIEALVPHLRPGGVYLCEDVWHEGNKFFDYVTKFANHLNAFDVQSNLDDPERLLVVRPTPFQQTIHSVHLYPMVAVVERRDGPITMVAPKHGTQWQPFAL